MLKNRQTNLPYVLACTFMMAMFYSMHAISVNKGIGETVGAVQVQFILVLGLVVVGIFSVIFLFYTNSFLMKRRKKEIGLYNILGMEKKHIAKMLFQESLMMNGICLVVGLTMGMLLSKLVFLVLLKILDFHVPFAFGISLKSLELTALVFSCIFVLTLLTNLTHIHLSKPIELLKGGQVGEREPKSKWLMTLWGIICIGAGYTIAIVVKSPLAAISLFFVAALLVMSGTYSLFTSGSIVFFKMLRKNKKYYYQTNHFTSVSSMIYRMKQNAVGLANICILSCAVLVMISTTVSLYVGMDDVLAYRFPKELMIESKSVSKDQTVQIEEIIAFESQKSGVVLEEPLNYDYISMGMNKNGKVFESNDGDKLDTSSKFYLMTFIDLGTFNRLTNQQVQLTEGQLLLFTTGDRFGQDRISMKGQSYDVLKELKTFPIAEKASASLVNNFYIVLKDTSTILTLINLNESEQITYMNYFSGFDFSADKSKTLDKEAWNLQMENYVSQVRARIVSEVDQQVFVESREASRTTFFGLYGGLLFLGIFLGIIFFMATALIIYYKQISEGYDDQARYQIMQKVGMSHHEVKKTIQSQIVLVFFLPLVTAVIHISVAFKMITRLLAVLNLVNVPLFLGCTVGSVTIFGLIYAGVYILTARAYYRIVR